MNMSARWSDRGMLNRVDVDLLIDEGVRLGSGSHVDFGMRRDDVQHALGGDSELLDTFVCGAEWAARFATGRLSVTVSATTPAGLDVIALYATGPGPAVVALDGIDLFGYPADEVVDALLDLGWPVGSRNRANAWIGPRRLWLSAAGGRSRASDKRFTSVTLYSPALCGVSG
jgi:hypothetical protein